MTQYLLDHLHTLVSLTYFADQYQSTRSFISEDLAIVKRALKERGTGILETIPGVTDGVRFISEIPHEETEQLITDLCDRLPEQDRLLPGSYVYLLDLFGELNLLRQVGRIIAFKYLGKQIDAVMTVVIKGVPIMQAVSYYSNVSFVIVRRDSKVTEGSTVSVNYVSGPSECTEKIEPSERSSKRGSKALVVDDFIKGGGTVSGMRSMVEEFEAKLAGIAAFAELKFDGHRVIDGYTSLLYVEDMDIQTRVTSVAPGDYFAGK